MAWTASPLAKIFLQGGLFIQAEISDPRIHGIASFRNGQAFTAQLWMRWSTMPPVQVAKPLVDTTVEEWDVVMATNLRPAFLLAKMAYPLFKAAGGGAIVNVSSVHAVQTSANIAAYAASKGGLLALTRAMAIEFARDNIRVNAILPGAVDTPMLRAGLDRGHVRVMISTPAWITWRARPSTGVSASPKKSPTPSISWLITPSHPS